MLFVRTNGQLQQREATEAAVNIDFIKTIQNKKVVYLHFITADAAAPSFLYIMTSIDISENMKDYILC